MKYVFTHKPFFHFLVGITLGTAIMLGTGCERYVERESAVFAVEQNEFQLTIIIDLSGSFRDEMATRGQAYRFVQMICDRYFRDRIGTNDRLVIAQISGTQEALLWEGTPLALRQDFPSPEAFRDFLYSKSHEGSSRVYENLARTLEYLLDRSPTSTSTKKALFILSDMLDNASDPAMGEQKAVELLSRYTQEGGLVGIYWVNQSMLTKWRDHLRNANPKMFCVESDIVSRPNLPSFE